MADLGIEDFGGWGAGWQIPDRRPIYEWAKSELTLPASYRIPGRFDVNIRRPLIGVFDAIQDMLVRRVHFRKPPRFGGSLINDISIPWIICTDPGPIMWNWQKDDAGAEHMKEKAWPLWRSSAKVRAMLPQGRNDVTTTEIYFGHFFLKVQGANPNNFQGKGIRWQFNEEIWLPIWQDLYNQAVSRTRDFAEVQCEKITNVSQAGNVNDVEDRSFRAGHQAVWGYKSPVDGKHYPLLMGGKRADGSRWGLVWSDDAEGRDGAISLPRAIETARYVCKETRHVWTDRPETLAEWNRDGAYIVQKPDAPKEIRSFSTNALLNNTFSDLVTRKVEALQRASYGDMAGLKDVKMQDECVPWEEQHLTVTIDGGNSGYTYETYANGEPWEGEKIRSMMVDRQHGMAGDTPHRWVEITAWQPNGASRQLFFGRVDTKEAQRELQQKFNVKDRCVWQDARFEKHKVFEECVEYGWLGVFGSDQSGWTHEIADPRDRKEKLKVRLPYSPIMSSELKQGQLAHYLLYCEDYCADILANLVAGRGLPHEVPDDVVPAYLDHLKAEHKVLKNGKYTWTKIHTTRANHGWDCSKQGIAFALLMKLLAMPKKAEEPKKEAAA